VELRVVDALGRRFGTFLAASQQTSDFLLDVTIEILLMQWQIVA
jgi:hypothetical protein